MDLHPLSRRDRLRGKFFLVSEPILARQRSTPRGRGIDRAGEQHSRVQGCVFSRRYTGAVPFPSLPAPSGAIPRPTSSSLLLVRSMKCGSGPAVPCA